MNNWDDKTENILTHKISKTEYNEKVIYLAHHNLNTEKWECEMLKNGEKVGVSSYYNSREQAMAWMRLMVGDYVDMYYGVA